MKYIRTKDEIFEVVKEDGDWLEIVSNFVRKMQCHCVIKKHAVINQADTIEELCDEFVVVIENKPHLIPREWLKQEIIVDVLYGAIWTDKGLIYVAKMNEKGELELL